MTLPRLGDKVNMVFIWSSLSDHSLWGILAAISQGHTSTLAGGIMSNWGRPTTIGVNMKVDLSSPGEPLETAALAGDLTTCSCSDAQLCPTLWDLMDCSPPGFSVHGIFQVSILECVAISNHLKGDLSQNLLPTCSWAPDPQKLWGNKCLLFQGC